MRLPVLASSLAVLLLSGCNEEGSDSGSFQTGTDGSNGSTVGEGTTGSTADSVSASATSTPGSDSTTGSGGGAIFDLGNGTGSVEVCGEPEENPIYLLTRGLETGNATSIQAFDPQTLTFTPVVAAIECEGTEADWGASSMAVDRERGAWITWSALADGAEDPAYKRLDRIDLDTGACETDVGQLPTTDNWGSPLGMAFVADGQESGNETLYFADTATHIHTLGSLESIGRFTPPVSGYSGVELTGSGDGRMFGLIMNYTGPWDHDCTAKAPCFPTVRLFEIDKADATGLSMLDLPGVDAFGIEPGGFAFAYWGGHIWVFTSLDFGPTQVFDHDPETRSTTLVVEDGAPGVVGAGVSTCAPLVLPEG
ncbi:MAG: hypothetical protein ACRBN8_32470 [Nannocystales bacterium]